MNLKKNLAGAMIALVLTACSHQPAQQGNQWNGDYLSAATLWTQNSAEWRAISYQAFNTARDRLDLELKKGSKRAGKKLAVVVDADETILDNSRFQAWSILNNTPYNAEVWKKWVDRAEATAMPGSVEFLQYAAKNGVEVFYITNRKDVEFEATLKNIMALGFPGQKENLLVRGKSSSKADRRGIVSEKYSIVLLIGDNMADFSELYEKKNIADRATVADDMQKNFGRSMIVLPNAMYGDWEGALYNYDFGKSEAEKASMRRGLLKAY